MRREATFARTLVGYLWENRARLAPGLGLALLRSLTVAPCPWLFQRMIDRSVPARDTTEVLTLAGVFVVLLGRFFAVQVLQHTEYALQSERNRLNEVPIPAARGPIYDRNGEIIAESVPGYTVSILAPRSDSLRAMLDRIGRRVELTRQQYFAAIGRHEQAPPG